MTYRALIRWSVLTMAIIVGAGLWALYIAPPGMEIPVHWNATGEIDGYDSVLGAVLKTSLISCGAIALIAAIPFFEPLQNKMDKSQPLYLSTWAAMLPFVLVLTALILAPAFGWSLNPSILLVAMSLLFIAIGNVLPKSRRSYFLGIRTPWTLADDENWIATHRFGGKVFMLGGASMLLSTLLPLAPTMRTTLVGAAIAAIVLLPIIYSFLYWKRHS